MLLQRAFGRVAVKARSFSAQSLKPSFFDRLMNDAPSQNPLNEEFPGVPVIKSSPKSAQITQSTLSNGLRVVSIDNGGAVADVGIFVQAGSRHESVPGTAHVLEHMAFAGTEKRSAAKLQYDIDNFGATVSSLAGREVFALTGEVMCEDAAGVLDILAEAATQARLKSWEVEESKHDLEILIAAQASNPRIAVIEALHAAGYGSTSAMGHSLYARSADLPDVTPEALRSFTAGRLTGKHVVVTGVNVSHAALEQAIKAGALSRIAEGTAIERATGSAPAFIGGEHMIRTTSGGVAHVAIALPAPSLASGKALHALGVWQALLGSTPHHGGAAGQLRLGPQRQSRIARSVHTEAHSFIRSLSAFALPYSDTGILGLAGSCADHESGRLVHAIAGFLKDSAGQPIPQLELERAKKQYKLAYLAQVEGRSGMAADYAHQLLLTGKWQSSSDALSAIDAITASDVQQVAKAALAAPPAIAAAGSLEQVPRYDVLAGLFK